MLQGGRDEVLGGIVPIKDFLETNSKETLDSGRRFKLNFFHSYASVRKKKNMEHKLTYWNGE
ncbi:hypothetical protein Syun_027651 [Stephania yunnanensis]|uniref:Uncharacterized protein n=1 Tax=Stephania yunnanensis TaxID=152371 RepID=A0AAP0EFZ7_9MAGN